MAQQDPGLHLQDLPDLVLSNIILEHLNTEDKLSLLQASERFEAPAALTLR